MLNFLKKKKDILAVILTSSDVLKARRAYETLKNNPKTVSMDIEIIVNSLNKNYLKEVQQEFKKEKLKITETQSNGLCGKGKNSVLDHFRNHKNKYHYLMPIDGDDFFYPTAFEQFEKLLAKRPDIVGLQISDELVVREDKDKIEESEFFHNINNEIYMNSWNEQELNLWKVFPKDVSKGIYNQTTPDRILFLSERILKKETDLYFPENLALYDDYVFDVRLYERALHRNYSYLHFSNSFCYIYDKTNDFSVSKDYRSNKVDVNMINKEIYQEMAEVISKCNNKVDFTIIPHFKLGNPKNFTTEDKLLFIRKIL